MLFNIHFLYLWRKDNIKPNSKSGFRKYVYNSGLLIIQNRISPKYNRAIVSIPFDEALHDNVLLTSILIRLILINGGKNLVIFPIVQIFVLLVKS